VRGMQPAWAHEPDDHRELSPDERGDVLVDLLELADALPPAPIGDLEFPPFHTLRRAN
jgi:hypothetical protein